jgi:hypothetical protein
MAFRRVIITIPAGEKKSLIEDDIKRLFSLPSFKVDFKDVKHEIKPSIKPEVIIIDLNGDGADSVSRKVKDLGIKWKADVKVRNEKPMSGIKEGQEDISIQKKAFEKLFKNTQYNPEFKKLWDENKAKIDQVTKNLLSDTYKSLSEESKINVLVKWVVKNLMKDDVKEGKAMPSIVSSVLDKLQDELGPEEANALWSKKIEQITAIINKCIETTGTSRGQKIEAAIEQIKQLQMNENKKPKFNIKKMILEALEQVKAEGKKEEAPKEESSEEVSSDVEAKPKAKKLEKDEIGKFYIVTRPAKADDNIVHETNVLDLVTKIKGGEIDGSRILGAFKKRGGANALAKVHLKQIATELDELQKDMETFRASKATAQQLKEKAKKTILKYKPNSDETEEATIQEGKKLVKK